MSTGKTETTQNHLDWLRLTKTEAEQLMLQKFFLEELTGLHHLHLLLEHYSFMVWELTSLLEHIKMASAALANDIASEKKIKELTNRMWLIASSDVNIGGHNTDLLAVYRKGMESCGANPNMVNTFVARLRRGESAGAILRNLGAGSGILSHVQHTQQLLKQNNLAGLVTALCFSPRLPNLKVLLRLIDNLDRKLPVLLMRIRYYFDVEIMLQEEIFMPYGEEILGILYAAEPKKWAESKQIINSTSLSRAAVLADVRSAIKRL